MSLVSRSTSFCPKWACIPVALTLDGQIVEDRALAKSGRGAKKAMVVLRMGFHTLGTKIVDFALSVDGAKWEQVISNR